MKKLIVIALAALVAVSAFGAAGWVGNGAINVNDTWYYANQELDWATGGAFTGDLGEIYSLTLGGQVQLWDENSADWGSGTQALMNYSIDNGSAQELSLTYYKFENNNNFFQSGGADFAASTIDISGLSEGQHTLTINFVDVDNLKPTDSVSATFTKAVPEPATMSLLGLGALAMVLRRKLRK